MMCDWSILLSSLRYAVTVIKTRKVSRRQWYFTTFGLPINCLLMASRLYHISLRGVAVESCSALWPDLYRVTPSLLVSFILVLAEHVPFLMVETK